MFPALAIAILALGATPKVTYLGSSPPLINGLPMSNCQALSLDKRGEFIVADALNDRIVFLDTLGNYRFDFKLTDNQHNPFGVAINSADELIIGSMDLPELWIYGNDGRFLEEISLPDSVLPGRMIVDSLDNIYLVNRAGDGVLKLDKSGNLLARYETRQKPLKPSGLCFEPDGDLLMVSFEGSAFIGFGAPGQVKFFKGEHGRRLEDFSHPTAMIFDSHDILWVVDSFRHHIKLFDRNWKFIDTFGERGTGPGDFYFPVDLKMTPSGILGVLDKGSGRLQLFRVNYEK